MLALVALLIIFLGLVGLLAVIGECQKRRRRRRQHSSPVPDRNGGSESLEQVKRWLARHQHCLPTPQQVMDLLSDSLRKFSSQEWREMTLTALNDEDLSGLELSEIISMDDNNIEFLCKLQDLPGVCVACVGEDGEKIVCDVKVEWLYALVRVVLAVDSDRLVVNISHKEPVKMSLSCSTKSSIEDGERIASSVADDLHVWFTTLTIDNAAFYSTIPAVLVSDHDDVINNDAGHVTTSTLVDSSPLEPLPDLSTEAPPTLQTADDQAVSSSSAISEEIKMEGGVELPESSEEVFMDEAVSSHALTAQQQHEQDNIVGAVPLMVVAEETDEEKGNDSSSQGLPISPTWRRSPSYEQLKQIELDPQRLVHSFNKGADPIPSHLMGGASDKRALTLSVSGSEAESIYGADERVPSTLVYEITDASNKIRHIVAVTTTHAVKLRRRYPHAKKLHIYNDHCFTASHIKRRVECCVCGSKISGLFGRQAYVCQDCKMIVHKHCHFKADGQCPQSQLQHMNLIYPDNTSTSSAN